MYLGNNYILEIVKKDNLNNKNNTVILKVNTVQGKMKYWLIRTGKMLFQTTRCVWKVTRLCVLRNLCLR